MKVPQKVKNTATIQSSNLTSGYVPEEDEITTSKRYLHPDVHGTIIYNSQDTETTEVSKMNG